MKIVYYGNMDETIIRAIKEKNTIYKSYKVLKAMVASDNERDIWTFMVIYK